MGEKIFNAVFNEAKGSEKVMPEKGKAEKGKAEKDRTDKDRPRKRKPGINQISLMAVFQLLQLISPRLSSFMAYHLWFHPGRESIKKIPPFTPEGVSVSTFRLNRKTVYYWCAGSGPAVLLVHGWASCGNQMADLAQALLDKGYKVIWMDAPAHGQSTGWQTNLFECAEAISEIQKLEGNFEAVIAHSFGVPCSLYAMKKGLVTNKFIAISTPATATGLIDKFCKIIKANQKTHQSLSWRMNRFIGDLTMSEIAAEDMAREIDQQCLVIHDKHDRMIRSKEGLAVQKNLKYSTFMLTHRLGHNRILKNPQVISRCIEFVQI